MSGHHHYTTKGYNGTNQRSAQHDRHDSSGKHRSGWGADREKTTYRVPRPDFESMAGPSRKLQRLLETRPGRDDYNQIYTRQYYMGLDTGTCVVKDSQTQCKEQKLETSNDDCDLEPPSPPTISDALPSLAPEPPMDINWDASNTAASGGDDDVDDNDPFSKKSKENQLLFNPEAKDIIVSINDNDINSDASNTAAAAAGYDGDNDPFSKKCRENQLYFNPEAKVIESISDNDINWDDDDDDPFSKKCKENQLYFNPEAKDFIASVSNKDKNDPLKSTNSTEHLWSRENAINSSSSSSSNSSNSSNIEIGEHEDDVLGHMTKFEKRRFKNALSAGFSHNEALKISADPLVFVGFTSNSPSTRNLSENQMAQLRALIEKTAVNSKFNTEIVTFYHERGWLKLACTNNTAGWLKSNFQELHKIYSLHINFVDEANFPPTFTVRGNFPDSLSFPTTKILDLIKAANNDMDVSLWKLVKRKATKEEHFLTFEIDGVSWCKLIKLRGIISYGHVNNLFLEMKEIKHSGNGNKATEKEATIVDATEELANELEHARGNFSRIHVIRGEFPRSHEYAEDKILNLVKAQNSVDISLWRVIHRTGETELDVITFEVDHRSWLKLKGENGLICYRFGHIQLDLYADAKSRLLVRANFLHSHNYSSGKVLALIKAQNDLNVSQWLPEPRTSEDLFFTFEVDEDSWCKLLERNGVISYRFGQMKLEMIETKALANHKAIDETTTKETLIVHGEFPHSTGYSTEKILTSIQTQNDLNVSLWKPLPRRSDKDLVYSFEVDASSWNKLKKQGGCITYGFGHVELEMLKKQSDGAMVQSSSFNLLCRRIVQGKFPSSKEYTAEKVLPLIKIQNDLDVSLWKPLPRSNNNNHDDSNFVFDIDESSWHKLQKTNGLISFGFGQVTLTLIDDGQNGGGGGVQFARPNQRQPSAYRRLIEGDFPGSNKSSAEQIVALIKSQNDLDVSLWKPLPKDTNDTIFCFEIDNNSWQKLQKKKGIISYRFNQIKLKFIDEEIEAQKAKYLAQRNTNESQGRHLVRGCFPHSQEYSPAHVLHLIQTQNYYVNLSLWKPLPRDKKDNIFSFETDKTSWQTLQKRKAQIYYGRGQVKLKLSYEKNDVGQGQMEQQIHDTSNVHIKEQNKHSVRNERPSSKLVVQDQGSRTSQKRKAYMRQHTDTASKRPRYEGQQYGSKEVSHRNNFKIRKKANNIEVGELGRPSTSGAAAPEKPSNIPSPYAHLPPSPPRLSKPTTMDRNMRSLQPPPPAMGNFSQTLNSTTKCADNSQNENQCNTGNDKRYGEISENFNKNAQHIGNSENNGKSGHIPEMAKPTDTASAADENESTKFFNSKASTTKASNKADNNTLNLNDGNFTKSENIDTIARKNSERTEQKFKTPKNHSITCNKSTSNFQLFPINLNIPALSDIGSVSTTQTLGIANTNRKRTSRFSEDTLKTDNMPGNKDVHLINNLSPFGNMGNSEGDLLHNRFNNNTGLSRQLPESAKGNYLPGNNAAASHISDVSRFENKGNSEGASNNRFNNNTGNCQQFPESAKSNNAPEKKDTQLKNDLPHFGNNGNGENAANNRYNNNTVNFQPFPKRNYLPGKSGTQNKNDLPRFGNNGNSEGSINNRFISNTGNFQPFPESAKSNYLPGKMDTRAKNDLPHVGNNGNTEGPINNRFNNSGKFQQMTETVRSSYFPGKKDARPINDFGNNGNSEGPINNNTGNFQQMPETVRSNYLSDKKDARPINDLPRFENNANSGDAVNNRFNNTGNFQQFPESAKGNYMSSNKDMRPINNVTRFGNNENVGVTDSNSSKNNIGNFQQFPETVKSSIFSSKMDVRPINDTTRFGSNENVVANDNNSSKNNTGNFQQLPKSSKSNYLSGNMNECASNHLRHFANNGYSESGVNNRFNNSTGHFPLFPNKTNPNYPSISGNMMRHTENYTSSVASKEKEYDDSNMSFPKNNWNFRIYDKQFCKPSPSPDYRNNNQVGGGGFTQQYGNTGISSNNNGAAVTNTGNFYKAITENNQQVAAKQNIENNIYKSKNNVPRKTRFDMGPAVIEKITNKTIEQNNNMVGNNENKEISSDSAGSRPCTGNTVNDKIFQQNENKLETFNQFPHGNETKTDYQTTGNNNAPPPPTAQPLYGNTESELGKNIQFGMKRRTNHRFFGKEMNHGHFNQFENNKNHSENSTQLFGSNNNHYCNVQQLPPSDSGFQINPLLLGGSGVMGGNQRFYEDINPAPPVEDCNNKNMENNCSNFHQQNRNNNHGNKVAHGFHKFGSNMRNIQRFGNNLEAAGQMRQFRNNNGPPQHFDINKNRQFARNSGQSRGRGGRGNFNQRGPKNNSNRAQSGFNTSQRFEGNQNAVTSQRFVGNANKLKRPLLKNSKRGGGGGGIKQKSFAKTLQNKFGKLLRKTKNVKIKPKITPAAKKEKKAAAKKLKKTKPDDGTDKKSSEDEHIDVNKEIFGDFQPIAVGLKKPAKGHLKPEPEEYWKQWWSLYGYVEKILPPPPTDPNEESLIKSFLHFQLTPSDAEFRRRKRILMVMGVSKILRHIRLNEKDYALRDIFNVLKYKHQLEDPQLHQHLAPKELERVQMVLKNAQKKTRRALFYQSMICRWHFSTVIIKRAENGESLKCGHAQKLIGNKVFNYLVWESIQELKKLILDDWPGFEEFYKTL